MKKSIFLFFAAILCAMSANAATKTIYFKSQQWWHKDNAASAAYYWGTGGNANAWPGTRMTKVAGETNMWSIEIDTDKYQNIIFTRVNGSGTVQDWGAKTKDQTIPTNGNNLFTLGTTEVWGDPGATGTWSTYTPPTEPVIPEYYITGTLADGWNANDVKMTYNETTKLHSHTFTAVTAGEEKKFKVTDGTWDASWGGDAVSPAIEGVTKDGDGNAVFTLSTGGDVTITFDGTNIQLTTTGSFTPVETFDYYVVGSFNGWNEKDPAHGMTLDGEVYKATITLAAGENLLKVTNGTWTDAKGYSAMGAEYEEVSPGASDDNIQVDLTESKEIVVVYNATTKKVTFEGLTEKAPAPTFDYYITGSFNGNNPKKAENGMTLDGAVYKATVTLAAGDNTLKVTDGTWEKTWGANELGAAYEEVSNPNDYNNIKITLAAEKEITVIFDATTDKITFEGLTPYVAPLTYTVTVPAGTEKCYIAGNMNGWAFQEMEAVTGETNKFTITIVGAKETDEYKYACQADWAYAEVIDGGGNRTNWSELDEVTAWNKPVVYTYYLMGVDDDWATGIEMEVNTDAENEVMLTCQPVNGEVKIKRVGDDDSEYWYGGKSLKEEDGNLGTNTGTGDEDGNILLEEGIYNFYFNTADGKLWIAAATDCVIEPEYNVVEDEITNFVFDMEAWPMVCMGGPSTNYQVEVFLTLTEDVDGTLAYEDCSVSIQGTDATFIDGTLSNIDVYAPSANAVLHVQWNGDYYELQLAMSSTPAEPIIIEAEDATVTLTEYPTNFEETEFAYELNMVANWDNEAESLSYTVEFVIPTFDPTAASGEYNANFYVTGEGDAAGMNENISVTVTKDGNNVTLTGNVSALNGNAYNVTISGTLPTETPDYTRTVEQNQWGTICLPNASSSFTGATFYEVSSLDPAKGLWLDQLKDGDQLVAGKPYIFYATATEITVTYTDAAPVGNPVAGANGLTGTFTDIASGGDLVGNYIIAENKVWVASASATLPANRAYINAEQVPTETQAELPGRRRVCMGENAATGLDQIVAPEGQAVKAIVNGQLIIVRDGVKYNVQGQVIK